MAKAGTGKSAWNTLHMGKTGQSPETLIHIYSSWFKRRLNLKKYKFIVWHR
jgi:hypothetical protein